MEIYLSPPAVLCCAGNGREAFFDAAVRGDQSGIRPQVIAGNRHFVTGRIAEPPVSAPAPVCTPGAETLPPEYAGQTRIFRITAAALEQIRPAVENVLAVYGKERIGVCVGSCDNGSEASTLAHRAFFGGEGFPSNYELRFQGASFLVEYISQVLGITGPAITVSTACASSAGAIVKGAEFIRAGICDAVIAGGVDIASDTVLLGFSALEAVSGTVSNPFSKNRKGITLGEGAAFFVLSREPFAGLNVPADDEGIVLLGTGESADAHHMTAPREDGKGAVQAMKAALSDAKLQPEDIDYINLHGTGTSLNDHMEALAVKAVFQDTLPLVSSTKPVTGHTLGAAGALELALCWMTLAAGNTARAKAGAPGAENGGDTAPAPFHCWDGEYDETLSRLRFAGTENSFPPGLVPRICMSNSFAFGGCNVSLIIGKKEQKQ